MLALCFILALLIACETKFRKIIRITSCRVKLLQQLWLLITILLIQVPVLGCRDSWSARIEGTWLCTYFAWRLININGITSVVDFVVVSLCFEKISRSFCSAYRLLLCLSSLRMGRWDDVELSFPRWPV